MFASLVLLMAAARKIDKKAKKCGASSGHITNLEQSIFSFDIYGFIALIFEENTSFQNLQVEAMQRKRRKPGSGTGGLMSRE